MYARHASGFVIALWLLASAAGAEVVEISPVEIEGQTISLYVETRRQTEILETMMVLQCLALGVSIFAAVWPKPQDVI